MSSPADTASAVLSAGNDRVHYLVHLLYRDGGGNLHLDWPLDRIEEAIGDQGGLSSGLTLRRRTMPGIAGSRTLASRGLPVPSPGRRGCARRDPRPQGGRLGFLLVSRLLRPPDRSRLRFAPDAGAGCLPRLELSRHLPRITPGDPRSRAREYPSRSSRPLAARGRSPPLPHPGARRRSVAGRDRTASTNASIRSRTK